MKLYSLESGTIEYTNCISVEELDSSNQCPGYDTSNVGASENAEYPFIAIALRFTLSRSGRTL